ncbi:MAG: hypothetical protein EOO27_43095, partial [Comamonadaceae bacterium]
MVPYSAKFGVDALKMPLMNAGVHVNIDYADVSDLERKCRILSAVGSRVSDVFSFSPYYMGADTGQKSYRRWVID